MVVSAAVAVSAPTLRVAIAATGVATAAGALLMAAGNQPGLGIVVVLVGVAFAVWWRSRRLLGAGRLGRTPLRWDGGLGLAAAIVTLFAGLTAIWRWSGSTGSSGQTTSLVDALRTVDPVAGFVVALLLLTAVGVCASIVVVTEDERRADRLAAERREREQRNRRRRVDRERARRERRDRTP